MKTVNITYFVHGSTTDNEKGIATGWSPGELSELGRKQCVESRELIRDTAFDVVFCSDLKRAIESAKLMFNDTVDLIQDRRLREVNLGDLTKTDSRQIDSSMAQHIDKPFPKGESCRDVEKRIASFLNELGKESSDRNVAIVSHRVPQLALEVLINKKNWKQAIEEDWRLKQPKEWKLGWTYELKIQTKVRASSGEP